MSTNKLCKTFKGGTESSERGKLRPMARIDMILNLYKLSMKFDFRARIFKIGYM